MKEWLERYRKLGFKIKRTHFGTFITSPRKRWRTPKIKYQLVGLTKREKELLNFRQELDRRIFDYIIGRL